MVVVDGQQAGEHRIETQQEQAAGGSSRTGEQAGAAGGKEWGKQEEQPAGWCQRQSATKAGRPLWDIKTKQNQNFGIFMLKYNSKILIKAFVNEFPHLITLHIYSGP